MIRICFAGFFVLALTGCIDTEQLKEELREEVDRVFGGPVCSSEMPCPEGKQCFSMAQTGAKVGFSACLEPEDVGAIIGAIADGEEQGSQTPATPGPESGLDYCQVEEWHPDAAYVFMYCPGLCELSVLAFDGGVNGAQVYPLHHCGDYTELRNYEVVGPNVYTFQVEPGDMLVIFGDGLHDTEGTIQMQNGSPLGLMRAELMSEQRFEPQPAHTFPLNYPAPHMYVATPW